GPRERVVRRHPALLLLVMLEEGRVHHPAELPLTPLAIFGDEADLLRHLRSQLRHDRMHDRPASELGADDIARADAAELVDALSQLRRDRLGEGRLSPGPVLADLGARQALEPLDVSKALLQLLGLRAREVRARGDDQRFDDLGPKVAPVDAGLVAL